MHLTFPAISKQGAVTCGPVKVDLFASDTALLTAATRCFLLFLLLLNTLLIFTSELLVAAFVLTGGKTPLLFFFKSTGGKFPFLIIALAIGGRCLLSVAIVAGQSLSICLCRCRCRCQLPRFGVGAFVEAVAGQKPQLPQRCGNEVNVVVLVDKAGRARWRAHPTRRRRREGQRHEIRPHICRWTAFL